MRHVTVVDALMGRGKSSAAVRYMNEHKGTKCFLYITPYLAEVGRVCELCDFEEPDMEFVSKSEQLKSLMRNRSNIASTHALFGMMDEEALELAKSQGYSLIIDESLSVIQGVSVSPKDMAIMSEHLVTVNEDGSIVWNDPEYSGKFDGYKKMADDGELYYCSSTMYEVMNPTRLLPFDEVFMLTYLFEGQLQKAYFDYFGFTYDTIGVEQDEYGYYFADHPDCPPQTDYSRLINIIGEEYFDDRINGIGYDRTALSSSWFKQRGKSHADVRRLRNNMHTFFMKNTSGAANRRLWTTFKEHEKWLYGDRNRYSTSFLPLNARATNARKDADSVAYLVNRFVNPNISKFFTTKGIEIDSDKFALSEMLQFIWRSAIREGKEIQLYMPSRRMRELLKNWMKEINCGGITE